MQYKANAKRKMTTGGSMIEGVQNVNVVQETCGAWPKKGCGNKKKQNRRNKRRIRRSRA